MKNLFQLYWPVDQKGYHIETMKEAIDPRTGGRRRYDELKLILPNGGPIQEYDPINEYPALHRILSKVDENNEKDVLGFTSRFGLLEEGGDNRPEDLKSLIAPVKEICGLLDRKKSQEAGEIFKKYVSPSFVLSLDTTKKKPVPAAIPANLRGAIWHLVLSEIIGGVKFVSCSQCGTIFPFRSSKQFCSKECRKAHHYQINKEHK